MTIQTVRTVCPHDCPDQCSIVATVQDGRVTQVAGDAEHPFTGGWLCGKVSRYQDRIYSPDRVLRPLRRVGAKGAGQFEPVTWEEALGEIAAQWRSRVGRYGSETLLGYAYSGHMGIVNRNLPRALFHALGATRMVTGTVCDSTAEAGWEYAVGAVPGTDPESVADSDLVICWGANVVTTNVHLVPLIDRVKAAGGSLVVIDPYRTRTARRADWHLAPRVGTDTALALGLMHVLVRDGYTNPEYIEGHTVGFTALAADILPQYTPDAVEQITGIAARDVVRLAHMYGKASAPFIRLGTGISRHAGGGMAVRTVACLPALVGAWTRPGGGALMETASAWGFDYDAVRRPDLLTRHTRETDQVRLGRALTELQDPPVTAFFVAASNPAVSCPDLGRVRAGLAREDLFTVVHDTFLTDTAKYADIVLPASTAFESEDLYRSYGTYYAQYGPRVIEPQGESRSTHWVVQALAERMGLTDPVFRRSVREHVEALLAGATGPTAELTADRLMDGAPGPVRLAVQPRGPEKTWFRSERMAADGLPALPEWQPESDALREAERWPLRLLTAPGHYQHHTAFAGVEALQRRQGVPSCVIHPGDAAVRGIADGEPLELFNDLGHVGLLAKVSEETLPGVVVVEGVRGRDRYLSGGPLNVLVADGTADMGGGAIYQSTRVEARRS